MINDFAIIVFIFLYNFDFMKIRVSSSHIMISFFLSSWSYNLINLVFINRFFFIDRFRQFSWKSRYSHNLRIKLFSNRERFAKSYSTYSINSALTVSFRGLRARSSLARSCRECLTPRSSSYDRVWNAWLLDHLRRTRRSARHELQNGFISESTNWQYGPISKRLIRVESSHMQKIKPSHTYENQVMLSHVIKNSFGSSLHRCTSSFNIICETDG